MTIFLQILTYCCLNCSIVVKTIFLQVPHILFELHNSESLVDSSNLHPWTCFLLSVIHGYIGRLKFIAQHRVCWVSIMLQFIFDYLFGLSKDAILHLEHGKDISQHAGETRFHFKISEKSFQNYSYIFQFKPVLTNSKLSLTISMPFRHFATLAAVRICWFSQDSFCNLLEWLLIGISR